MRKLIALTALAGMVGVAAASGYETFVKTLQGAKTLKTTYSVTLNGEAPITYSLDFKKPNLARIDSATELIVADGKNITRYDKANKTYYKTPENETELKGILSSKDLLLWSPFFGSNGFHVETAKDNGKVTRKGMELSVVNLTFDSAGNQKGTLYISTSDNVARQAVFESNKFGMSGSSILDTKSLTVDSDLKDNTFAFAGPDGSREVSADELTGKRWYFDLSEAEAVAARTGKKIFVDFFATWCGPCKMLAHDVLDTEAFTSRMSKHFVFCRIDVDAQPNISQQYGITAMPTQMVLDKDGNVLGKTVGYGGPEAFYEFIKQYVSG